MRKVENSLEAINFRFWLIFFYFITVLIIPYPASHLNTPRLQSLQAHHID